MKKYEMTPIQYQTLEDSMEKRESGQGFIVRTSTMKWFIERFVNLDRAAHPKIDDNDRRFHITAQNRKWLLKELLNETSGALLTIDIIELIIQNYVNNDRQLRIIEPEDV